MPNSILSNKAAMVAGRNVARANAMATASVARLSSGNRLIAAKDDAAALAVGSTLRAEVKSLQQAKINAGQAASMLQIADGAYQEIDNILVRMKTLAVQAGDDSISDTDRTRLNNEFVQLRTEITRIADDTKFNGNSLLNGSFSFSAMGAAISGSGTSFDGSTGITNITFRNEQFNSATSNVFDLRFDAATDTFSVTLASPDSGEASLYTGTVSGGGATFSGSVTLNGAGGDSSEQMIISLNGFDLATSITTLAASNFTVAVSGSSSFTFKVGTGTTASQDELTVSLTGATATNLSVSANTITTSALADTASGALDTAIGTLADARASLGAYQSRIDFAAANIDSSVENTEAARSNLLDVDVAAEISAFTSYQILVQAGSSMLAQAQSLPQNLLRLFQ